MIALNFRDRTFTELAGPLWLDQAAPLGWLVLQRALLLEFGSAERTLRALPLLFGLATLWLAVWAGRRWMQPVGAAALTLLCSLGMHLSFFPIEAKHYSGDAFFGMLLPVLAVWALEPLEDGTTLRWPRILGWWVVASAGQWLANGALFVAPACATALFLIVWQRAGVRNGLRAMLPVFLLVASFGAHYWLATRHALHNEYLQDYWWHAFPPSEAGLSQTVAWLGSQIPRLAHNPGGTGMWAAFWFAAIAGTTMSFRRHTSLGLVLTLVPLSAFVFASLRLVPLEERLSLWVLPALYIATAITLDRVRTAASLLIAVVGVVVTLDIVRTGAQELRARPKTNHSLDDRAGVRFLMTQRQPGDVLVTTQLGLPAMWWYAGIDVAPPNLGRSYKQDGAPVLEVRYLDPGPKCRASDLTTTLDGRTRVAVYLGFASRIPEGLQELVLDTLSARGRLIAYRAAGEEGVAAVFDLREPPASWSVLVTRPSGAVLEKASRPAGCVGFFPATRW